MAIPNVFLDANIFFAGTKSERGGSRLILELGAAGKLRLITVKHALLEAEKNIENKLGLKYLELYHELLLESNVFIESISQATLKEINFLAGFLSRKDIPILLGALYSKCAFLVTLDKKDLVENSKLSELSLPFTIVTPGNFIQKYLS